MTGDTPSIGGEVVLGVDVGSSSCKTVAVDRLGSVVAFSTVPYPTSRPRPGWAEQDADDWYSSAVRAISGCVEQIGKRAVAGLAVDGAAHNVAVLGRAGEVLAPVIHWSDLRSAPQARSLEDEAGEEIFSTSWHVVNPGWTLAQLAWIRQERPQVWKAARHFLVTKDYVRYRLTGLVATDPYDAVGTQLYDQAAAGWSEVLCHMVGLDPGDLPEVLDPTVLAGAVTPHAAAETGLVPGTPVLTGSGDAVTEAAGVGVTSRGESLVKLGTSGTVLTAVRNPVPDRRLLTYPHAVPGLWVVLAATNSGAATLRWFHDAFLGESAAIDDLASLAALAADAPPASEGLLFHPFLMGERSPYWDPGLRGAFSGVSASHRLHHFVRAVLEGVAFSLRDGAEAVETSGYPIGTVKLIGGGTRSDLWCQAIADVLARPMTKVDIPAPAYGSALVAGIGLGWFNWDDLPGLPAGSETLFEPRSEHTALYSQTFARYRRLVQFLRSDDNV